MHPALHVPLLVASVLLAANAPRSVCATASNAATGADVPIELPLAPYVASLRTVEVELGGTKLPFLFDTGGGGTVIDLALAKRIGCEPFGRGTGFRHDGQRVDGMRGGPLDIHVGAFARRGEVGVIDLAPLLGGLPPVGGIVSLQTFDGRALTIDLPGGRAIVETAQSLGERTRGAHELQIRVARPAAGAALDVFVALEGKHGPLWFELDSGNVAPVLVAPHAFVELGIAPPTGDAPVPSKLRFVGLGEVECAVASKEMIYDGLLNAEFFTRHVITLDLEHGRGWARAAN